MWNSWRLYWDTKEKATLKEDSPQDTECFEFNISLSLSLSSITHLIGLLSFIVVQTNGVYVIQE